MIAERVQYRVECGTPGCDGCGMWKNSRGEAIADAKGRGFAPFGATEGDQFVEVLCRVCQRRRATE